MIQSIFLLLFLLSVLIPPSQVPFSCVLANIPLICLQLFMSARLVHVVHGLLKRYCSKVRKVKELV